MSFPFSAYMSSLDSLVFDNVGDPACTDNDAAEELALWSNAQFTFDIKPGSDIFNQEKPTDVSSTLTPGSELNPAMFEKLANYLDYELPQQQQQQQPQPNRQADLGIFPLASPVTAMPSANVARIGRQPLLLPKFPAMDGAQGANLVPINTPGTTASKSAQKKPLASKRPLSEGEVTEDQIAAEEDKRRRNTAASARFRIKKKQREQAMEQSVREMTEKSNALQNRVDELEKEVEWLRGLLIEKNKRSSKPTTSTD